VQLSCGSESLWRRLCAEFGLDPDAPGLATNAERVQRREEVLELLERIFADIGPEDLLARLAAAGVPAGKVRSVDEVYGWDQALSQGLVVDVEHATLGRVQLPGPPLRFFAPGSDGETETTRHDHAAPPVLDGDGAALRAEFAAPAPDGVPQERGDDVEDGHAT
jgi:crotonobetainyl-CoA:carnitine CoA-transferase CaiB-like acyl-CoA transferase